MFKRFKQKVQIDSLLSVLGSGNIQ